MYSLYNKASHIIVHNQSYCLKRTQQRLLLNKMTTNPYANEYRELATIDEVKEYVSKPNVVIVDVRDATAPSDIPVIAQAPLPSSSYRPKAINLVWDRTNKALPPIPETITKDTPIITHCGGGSRGTLAQNYLQELGYNNVINGGGPRVQELWDIFGHL